MRDFVKADVKGPRYRKGYKKISFVKLHKEFTEKHGQISLESFRNIICSFSKFCCDKVAELRDGIELPEYLGQVQIKSYREKRKLYDIPTSIKLGKLVTYTNLETDGYNAKIYYSNINCEYKFQNREIWKFVPVREFKKAASEAFLNDWKKYEECVPKPTRMNKIIEKMNNPTIEKGINIFNDYNEFEI